MERGRDGLETDVQYVKGVGPRNAPLLAKLGIKTAGDLLRAFPRRYEDRSHVPPITAAMQGQTVTVRGKIARVTGKRVRTGVTIVAVRLIDRDGEITLLWFNQPWVQKRFMGKEGTEAYAYGTVRLGSKGLEMSGPEVELVEDDEAPSEFGIIVPVYPLTEGLVQRTMRRAVNHALAAYVDLVRDPLPEKVRARFKLAPLAWSLRQMHRPESEGDRERAYHRIVFDEFLGLQMALTMKRMSTQREAGIAFPIADLRAGRKPEAVAHRPASSLFVEETPVAYEPGADHLWAEVRRMLPFEPTRAQARVIEEIWADMALPHPMNRLVQGDVGSGKTAVAACAILAAVRSGYQAALMAPTEILAEQHSVNLRDLFDPLGIRVQTMMGKHGAKQRKAARDQASLGIAKVLVGTHALIQEGVQFENLGLAIVDEQHRFGVLQRAALREKSHANPDVLVMTATPIPRTLAMAFYGDLDQSIIDELPPGRRPIKTHRKLPHERDQVYAAVDKLIDEGRQAYVVCPLIEDSEAAQTMAAEEVFSRLSTGPFRHRRLALLHGKMKPVAKEEVMKQFRQGEIDVLVATVVIEVGVDVPNATVMVIEDAQRFGLSQLHQLRGRVGRGSAQSYCILIARQDTPEGIERIKAMVETTDGFKIAERDMQLRGAGDLVGTRQSGMPELRIGDLIRDGGILEEARNAALLVLKSDPELARPEHAGLAELVAERWSGKALVVAS